MKHKPNSIDVAMDLQRCFYASFSADKTNNKNYILFFENAMKDFKKIKKDINNNRLKDIDKCISQAQNKNLPVDKIREDLLTASILLM